MYYFAVFYWRFLLKIGESKRFVFLNEWGRQNAEAENQKMRVERVVFIIEY
jgi:hypothetical protein